MYATYHIGGMYLACVRMCLSGHVLFVWSDATPLASVGVILARVPGSLEHNLGYLRAVGAYGVPGSQSVGCQGGKTDLLRC